MKIVIDACATLLLVVHASAALAQPADFAACTRIAINAERLACYDAAAHRTPSRADAAYADMDIVDFKTDRAGLKGQKVQVNGLITAFGEQALLMGEIGDLAGVAIDIAGAPREDRRALASCANACKVTVRGTVAKVLMQDGIKADRLVFK